MHKAATALLAVFLVTCPVRGEDELTGRVLRDRVNLRAKADGHSEVVGQASEGDLLTIKSMSDEWVEVVPPTNVQLWVHREFLDNGKVTVNKLNVRAGAGANFSVVGQLAEGAEAAVTGGFGEWVSIAPPPNCSLWVSRELIEPQYPETPVALPSELPPPQGAVAADDARNPSTARAPPGDAAPDSSTPAPGGIDPGAVFKLVPLQGQGRAAAREGEVKPSPFMISSPGPFRLIERRGVRVTTICYLRGEEDRLASLQGRPVKVSGREYWVQGFREPVIAVEHVTPVIAPSR
jgi:hypothetical protein